MSVSNVAAASALLLKKELRGTQCAHSPHAPPPRPLAATCPASGPEKNTRSRRVPPPWPALLSTCSATCCRRRLCRTELQKSPVEGFSAGLVDDGNIYEWEILIMGPPDTF